MTAMWYVLLTSLLIIGGFAVLVGVVRLIHHRQLAAAQRAEALDQTVSQIGLRALDQPQQAFAEFTLLPGGAKNIKRAFSGEIGGRHVYVIEHRYVVSTGQTTSVIHHEAALTTVPKSWPKVTLKPENVLTRLGAKLGVRGVEVEDEQFNARWRVSAKYPSFAELLLTPEIQAVLRDQPRGRVWHLERGYLAVMERRSIRAEDLPVLVEDLVRVAGAIPPELDAWTPAFSLSATQL